jgi:hypothetical protein
MSTQIQCPCGATKIELTAGPAAQFYCHCRDCQTAHSAAYVAISAYPADSVTVVKGEPRSWMVESTPRFSCSECGTRLFIEQPGFGIRGVLARFLPAGQFSPHAYIYCDVLPVTRSGLESETWLFAGGADA